MPKDFMYKDSDEWRTGGLKCVGYDADTGIRTYRSKSGNLYEGQPWQRYGPLHPVYYAPRGRTDPRSSEPSTMCSSTDYEVGFDTPPAGTGNGEGYYTVSSPSSNTTTSRPNNASLLDGIPDLLSTEGLEAIGFDADTGKRVYRDKNGILYSRTAGIDSPLVPIGLNEDIDDGDGDDRKKDEKSATTDPPTPTTPSSITSTPGNTNRPLSEDKEPTVADKTAAAEKTTAVEETAMPPPRTPSPAIIRTRRVSASAAFSKLAKLLPFSSPSSSTATATATATSTAAGEPEPRLNRISRRATFAGPPTDSAFDGEEEKEGEDGKKAKGLLDGKLGRRATMMWDR
ncbi:hypothetical protein VTJ04DRAFT_3899 [Mycothermus thermophilus]|uniref:uncharacterized protein n=1 Tax=Humicola insolens TaxID=85995 RepID=UPI003743A1DB